MKTRAVLIFGLISIISQGAFAADQASGSPAADRSAAPAIHQGAKSGCVLLGDGSVRLIQTTLEEADKAGAKFCASSSEDLGDPRISETWKEKLVARLQENGVKLADVEPMLPFLGKAAIGCTGVGYPSGEVKAFISVKVRTLDGELAELTFDRAPGGRMHMIGAGCSSGPSPSSAPRGHGVAAIAQSRMPKADSDQGDYIVTGSYVSPAPSEAKLAK